KRRISGLVLLDAGHSCKAAADHARSIMVAVAGQIADRHFGVRQARLDQSLDLGRGHRHQLLLASMIWRRASISLLRSASRTCSSSISTLAAVKSPRTLRITS